MVVSPNGGGRGGEVPAFPAADVDLDFGPNLPNALQRPVFNWLLQRIDVAEADKNAKRVAGLIRGEVVESEKSHNLGETSHLVSELADIYFFLDSFRFGVMLTSGGQMPVMNNHWIHAQSLTAGVGSRVYDHLQSVSGDLEMGGKKSIPALEEMYIQVLALWRELSFLGTPISVMNWIAEIKNTKNFPVEAASGVDSLTGQFLLPHERQAQHDHSRAVLKLLRNADGRKDAGLSPDLYDRHRQNILDFRNSETALNDLSMALTGSNSHVNGVK